jgi:hypothetical protein
LNSGGPSPSPPDALTGEDAEHRHTADSRMATNEVDDLIMVQALG